MRRSDILWCGLWLLALTGVTAALVYARSAVVARLDRPEARAQWQAWKAETERAADPDEGPVQRRVVKADEPPALILLRDHFLGVLVACLVVGGALAGFLIFVLRGMLSPSVPRR